MNTQEIKEQAQPSNYPTVSDRVQFMRDLGFKWNNDCQIYYDYHFNHIEDNTANRLYEKIIGKNPYNGELLTLKNNINK